MEQTMNSPNMPQSGVGLPQQTNRPMAPAGSLYQRCLTLADRLLGVPGFEQYLDPNVNLDIIILPDGSLSPASDPVKALWTAFRTGAALCALFNAARPKELLEVKELGSLASLNDCKKSVYKFLLACKTELQFREEQMFSISELYKDDTNGFVKVVQMVTEIVDRLEAQGLVRKDERASLRLSGVERWSTGPIGNREKVVAELLETERKYVNDLEVLQDYMQQIENCRLLPLMTIRKLFVNLNALVDFQRRFLIGIEANANLPQSDQRFGTLFLLMEEEFAAYEPFCANYAAAIDLAVDEAPNLMKLAHVLEPVRALPALLITPVQRICKYPLLLGELIKYTDAADEYLVQELEAGRQSIRRVTDRVNEERRRQDNAAAVVDLTMRVIDWKGHRLDTFGPLLLSEKFVMTTQDYEREMAVFLFQKILLFCKESSSGKLSGTASQLMKFGQKSPSSPKRGSLQLKGRVYTSSVTGVINSSVGGTSSIKVFWADVEMEAFTITCRNEEQLNQWKDTLSRVVEEEHGRKLANAEFVPVKTRSTVSAPNLDPREVSAMIAGDAREQSRRSAYPSRQSTANVGARQYREDERDGVGYRTRTATSAQYPEGGQARAPVRTSSATLGRIQRRVDDKSHMVPDTDQLATTYAELMRLSPEPEGPRPRSRSVSSLSPEGRGQTLPFRYKSPPPPVPRLPESLVTQGYPPGTPSGSAKRSVKAKVSYGDDIFVIAVPPNIRFTDLLDRIEKKLRLGGGLPGDAPMPKLRYLDDGDYITVNSDEDVAMAFEVATSGSVVQFFAT